MSPRGKRIARAIAAVGSIALCGSLLVSCSADQRETVRFTFSKREAIDFMSKVVSDYNASQNKIRVELDTSGVDVVSASFVRGNPPDLMLANYNFEIARFLQRCALSDLSNTKAAKEVRSDLTPLINQYGTCAGRTSALPYSVMASSVIYNKQIFKEHNLEVPKTWTELQNVIKTLEGAGVTPFYATFKDDWTIGQGWYDYSLGGSIDVIDFFNKLNKEGDKVGPNSSVSFEKDALEPMNKMLELSKYTNPDAANRGYNDGNLAFAQGKGAMYLQGPWAFSEIAKTSPDLQLGTFPLPMTDDPKDLSVRVNMDLAAMIPERARHPEAAKEFMEYLYQPKIIQAYNDSQLGFTPTTGAAAPKDPRVAGMQEYYDDAKVYQGPSVLVPKTIPVFSYAQAMILGAKPETMLETVDEDWARIAFRQPAVKPVEEDGK